MKVVLTVATKDSAPQAPGTVDQPFLFTVHAAADADATNDIQMKSVVPTVTLDLPAGDYVATCTKFDGSASVSFTVADTATLKFPVPDSMTVVIGDPPPADTATPVTVV